MPKIEIDIEKCKGCGLCIVVCPKKTIEISAIINKKGLHPVKVLKKEECAGCGFCAIICPDGAVTVYK